MENDLDQAMNWIEIIKAAGPYIVAVAGMAFGFFQSGVTWRGVTWTVIVRGEALFSCSNLRRMIQQGF